MTGADIVRARLSSQHLIGQTRRKRQADECVAREVGWLLAVQA